MLHSARIVSRVGSCCPLSQCVVSARGDVRENMTDLNGRVAFTGLSGLSEIVTPYTSADKFESFERINSNVKQTEILTHATYVNGWEPAVYMSCMSQNFRLFHVRIYPFETFELVCSCIRGQWCALTAR